MEGGRSVHYHLERVCRDGQTTWSGAAMEINEKTEVGRDRIQRELVSVRKKAKKFGQYLDGVSTEGTRQGIDHGMAKKGEIRWDSRRYSVQGGEGVGGVSEATANPG